VAPPFAEPEVVPTQTAARPLAPEPSDADDPSNAPPRPLRTTTSRLVSDPAPEPDPEPALDEVEEEDTTSAASDLALVARRAAVENPTSAEDSVAQVARAYEIDSLDGLDANEQVDLLSREWRKISPKMAQQLANRGQLVVAGKRGGFLKRGEDLARDEDGKPVRGLGHVAVIVPGALADDEFPVAAGGSRKVVKDEDGSVTIERGPAFRAEGRRVDRIWTTTQLPLVSYYTPN